MSSTPVRHIVIDARFWHRSAAGLSTYTQELVRHLARVDNTNHYTILINQEDVAEFDVVAPNVKALVVNVPHYSIAEQTKLPKIIEALKPDLVHFLHFNHPLRYKGKFVVTMHDLTVVYFPVGRQQRNPLRRQAFMAVMRHAAKAADRVIAVSQTTKDDIVKDLHGDPTKITVVYEGLTLATRTVRPAELDLIHVRTPYLLYVSQWRPHKRIEDVVSAFEQLARKHPTLQLVLCGKPNRMFPAIIDRVEHSPMRHRIITPGFVPDDVLPTLYNQAELFVFPSLYEGFGFPPLEAMAMDAPVLATNASCLPEILGDAAVYFEPKNVNDLADKIDELIENPKKRQELAKLGKVQSEQYDWKKAAHETLAIYGEVIGQ